MRVCDAERPRATLRLHRAQQLLEVAFDKYRCARCSRPEIAHGE